MNAISHPEAPPHQQASVESYALGLIAEEAGEILDLIDAVSPTSCAIRDGQAPSFEDHGHRDPINGRIETEATFGQAIARECGDLLAAADYAAARGMIDAADLRRATEATIAELGPETGRNVETYKPELGVALLAGPLGRTIQAIGKALRFGIDTPGAKHPRTGEVMEEVTPRTVLLRSLASVAAHIGLLSGHGALDDQAIQDQRAKKASKLLSPDSRDNLGRRLAP